MTVPTSYTTDQFIDFLRRDVLYRTAMEIGWYDVPRTAISEVMVVRDASIGDTVIKIAPAEVALGVVGAQWLFSNGVTATQTATVAANATSLPVSALTAAIPVNHVGAGYTVFGAVNPAFEAILNQTLDEAGFEDISDVTTLEHVKRLRMYGRREAWKAAARVCVGDYDYTDDGGGGNRSQLYNQVFRLFQIEDARVRRFYETQDNAGVPVEANSGNTGLTIVW